jgi:hypothetical protein
MTFHIRQKNLAVLLIAALWVLTTTHPALAQQSAAAVTKIREQVQRLNAKAAQVRVTLATGGTLNGHIVQVDNETFILRQKAGPDMTVQYAAVTRIQKQGRGKKAILIPAIIGGAAVVVLCVAPYPIGFLCRRDPS